MDFKLKIGRSPRDGGLHLWLLRGGVPVTYAKVYHQGGVLELCDIETREGYRHSGNAKKLLELLKEKFQVTEIFYNGDYSPEGYRFIRPLITPGYYDPPAPAHGRLNFVKQWDTLEPLYS